MVRRNPWWDHPPVPKNVERWFAVVSSLKNILPKQRSSRVRGETPKKGFKQPSSVTKNFWRKRWIGESLTSNEFNHPSAIQTPKSSTFPPCFDAKRFSKKISWRSLLQPWAFQFLHYSFLCLDLLKMRVKRVNKNIFSTWGGNLPPKIVPKVDVPKWFPSHSQSFVGFRRGTWSMKIPCKYPLIDGLNKG